MLSIVTFTMLWYHFIKLSKCPHLGGIFDFLVGTEIYAIAFCIEDKLSYVNVNSVGNAFHIVCFLLYFRCSRTLPSAEQPFLFLFVSFVKKTKYNANTVNGGRQRVDEWCPAEWKKPPMSPLTLQSWMYFTGGKSDFVNKMFTLNAVCWDRLQSAPMVSNPPCLSIQAMNAYLG